MAILTADVFSDRQHGSLLNIYHVGGKAIQVQPPVRPYLYSTRPLQEGTMERRKFLSDMQYHDVWKQEFFDDYERDQNRSPFTIEDRLPLKMRIAIDCGYKFASEYPKIISYDLETFCEGLSPDWRRDRIRSIACWDGEKSTYFEDKNEKKMICDFLDYIHKEDPDIICDFNGRFYDILVLKQRCETLMLKCSFGRDGSIPYVLKKEYDKRGRGRLEHTILIRGRCHFDVHKEVQQDYTLTLAGLKTRSLKEVARHYGLNPIEIDYSKMDQMTSKELEAYNVSDTKATLTVGEIYFQPLWTLAEYLNIPVEMVINRAPSHIASIVLGKELKKIDVVSDGTNAQRFPQFFASGKKAIQGAEPRCFQTGIFIKNLKHKDFRSMYLNINRALNLSPETVTLISITPYTGQYRFQPEKGYCIVEVPDDKNGQVTIRIDLSKKGVMRKVLDDVTVKRNESKVKLAETNDRRFKSEEIAYKLIGNLFFGYNTMASALYGNVLIGCLDAAIPRLLIDEATKFETANGNVILESDTDGFYLIENNPVTFDASKVLPSCFETNLIQQDTKSLMGMIILEDVHGDPAAKSYILKDSKGKITKHGSSILSTGISPIVDYFVDELAMTLFNGEDANVMIRRWTAKKITSYPVKAFVQHATLSKQPDEYNSSSMYACMVKQLKEAGIEVRWGDRVSYVACKGGFVPVILFNEKLHKINATGYQDKMASIASRILQVPYKTVRSYMKGDTLLESYPK